MTGVGACVCMCGGDMTGGGGGDTTSVCVLCEGEEI